MKFKDALLEKMNPNVWVASYLDPSTKKTGDVLVKASDKESAYKKIADKYSDLKVQGMTNWNQHTRQMNVDGVTKWVVDGNSDIYLTKESLRREGL